MKRLAATFGALLLLLPLSARADEPDDGAPPGPPLTTAELEAKTANEDLAALQFYRTSLNKLAVLAKQKENTAEEPIYLFRIAEAQYKVAALSFRLAHSTKSAHEGQPDLKEYHNSLDQLAKLASKISTKYPRHPNIARAIYLRAQAYKELDKDAESIRDFRYLIDNFPQNEDMVPAQTALYDLFNRNKDYKTAIAYLKRFPVAKTENYYPVSLDHLAFANFSINDIPEALKYLEQELAVFPPKESVSGVYSEREKILTNAALFYYTGLENKLPAYTVAGAITYFKHLQPGPVLSKMVSHFSNLLRSKGRDDDLEQFKKSVIASNLGPAETTEMLLASIENSLNKRRFDRLKDSTDELAAIISKITPEQRKAGKSEKMQKLLSEAASNLNQTFVKTKDTPDAAKVTPVLISLYSLMLKVSDTESARQKIEFNMAEIFLGSKRYEAAALHYRWIADLKPPTDKEGQKLQMLARFKSLTARYESLSEQKAFPKALAAKPIKGSVETPLSKESAQWIEWLDQYEKGPHEEPADAFAFEASRLLYMAGKIEEAVTRLRAMLKAYPKSTYVVSASSLILDTYVASERWEDSIQLANEFYKTADPTKTDFKNKLLDVAGDSYFKTVEVLYKNKTYAEALARAESFFKLYPTSKRRQSALMLAGNAALALKDKKRALTYFAPLMKDGASTEMQGTALLTTAAVAEEKYDFEGAAAAYRKYLMLPSKGRTLEAADLRNLKTKLLEYSWFTGQPTQLKAVLNTPAICTADISESCEQFAALQGLMEPARATDKTLTNRAWDRAHKAPLATRAIWAALALENYRSINFNNRIQLFDIVSAGWDKLEPRARFALLPALSSSIPAALKQASAEIRAMSKLKLEKADLDRRTNLIQKMEAGTAKLLDLPWQRIRVGALHELANLYSDFAKDLAALPAPAGLAGDDLKMYSQTVAELKAPFIKKSEDYRKQALDTASEAAVEAETYNQIAQAYSAEHPTTAGQPKAFYSQIKGAIAGPEILGSIHAPATLTTIATHVARIGNWGALAYVIQDAKDKSLMNEAQLAAARGVSLSLAGAQAESLTELKDASLKLENPGKQQVLAALAVAYSAARSPSKAKAAIEDFLSATGKSARESILRPDFAAEIADGAALAGAALPGGAREELVELARHPRAPASQGRAK